MKQESELFRAWKGQREKELLQVGVILLSFTGGTCARAQKEIQTMEFSTVCKTNAGSQLLASNLVQD